MKGPSNIEHRTRNGECSEAVAARPSRNPKSEQSPGGGCSFGVRVQNSDLFRISDFGLRISKSGRMAAWVVMVIAAPALAADTEVKLLPPHGELPPTFWEQHGALAVIGALLVLGLIAVALWLWLRPKPALQLAPAVEARQGLEPLRLVPEDVAVLGSVSRIIRKYFVRTCALSAGEPTTTELMLALSNRSDVHSDISKHVGELLRQCDERKFSSTTAAQPLSAVTRAFELIAQVEAARAQAQAVSKASS